MDTDTEIEEISPPLGSHSRVQGQSTSRKSMKSEKSSLIKTMQENSRTMASAIEKLAAAVASTLNNGSSNNGNNGSSNNINNGSSNNGNNSSSNNINNGNLEERLARVEARVEKNAEETNMLLREFLTRLPQQSE